MTIDLKGIIPKWIVDSRVDYSLSHIPRARQMVDKSFALDKAVRSKISSALRIKDLGATALIAKVSNG